MNATELKRDLADLARWTEAALDRLVPPATARPAPLHAAMRHSLFAGGKRVRPALCASFAEVCGADRSAAEYPAAAIECLHTYTLIHDDLPCMDDDDLRRGVPTCHKVYGEATALLAGDALQALAFQLLAAMPAPPEVALACVAELASAAGPGAVVGGQVEDMLAEGLPPDADRLLYIQRHKTGDLIACACRMGVLAARGPSTALDAATRYAAAIGESFQIADDLLNLTSDPATLGKATGTDAARGKLTAVSVYGESGARARLAELTDAAIAALSPLPGDTARLAELARYIADRPS
jgi:geranylgeranyl pyrophosphate synthase